MLYESPAVCPVCQGRFRITRLECTQCGSALTGSFLPDRLSSLTEFQQRFVVGFLKCRGNIREMEKTFGISYPTVRARLDEIVTALGEQPEPAEEATEAEATTHEAGAAAVAIGATGAAYEAEAETPEAAGAAWEKRVQRIEILKRLASGQISPDDARILLEPGSDEK